MIIEKAKPVQESIDVKESIQNLSKNVQALIERMGAVERRTNLAYRQSNDTLKLQNGDLIEQAKDDAKSIHDLYRLLYLKMSVATEVLWIEKQFSDKAGKLAIAVISAFDKPDRWWLDKEHCVLGEWIKILSELDVEKPRKRRKAS